MPCLCFKKQNILQEKLQHRKHEFKIKKCDKLDYLRNTHNVKIYDKIDEGYSGIVFSGSYNNKIIAAKVNKNKEGRQRIHNEYNVIEDLRRKVRKKNHIINAFQIIMCPEKVYMIMELCIMDLFTFSQKFILHEERTEINLKPVMKQMIQSVMVCHDAMFTHGDIKLENFMITNKFTVVLGDFGFGCRHFSYSVFSDKYMGSLCYISPQMCKLKNNSTAFYSPYKNDLWGLGISLFAIMFNSYPFISPELQCAEYKVYEQVPSWSNLIALNSGKNKIVSNNLKRTILTLLSPLESQRYVLKHML